MDMRYVPPWPRLFFLRLDFFYDLFFTLGEGGSLYYEWKHKRNKKEEKRRKKKGHADTAKVGDTW